MADEGKVVIQASQPIASGLVTNAATLLADTDRDELGSDADGKVIWPLEVHTRRLYVDEALRVDGDQVIIEDGYIEAKHLVQTNIIIANSAQIGGAVIQAGHIHVDSLSAINADLGTITAGQIIVTDLSGNYVIIGESAEGIQVYDSSDNLKTALTIDGLSVMTTDWNSPEEQATISFKKDDTSEIVGTILASYDDTAPGYHHYFGLRAGEQAEGSWGYTLSLEAPHADIWMYAQDGIVIDSEESYVQIRDGGSGIYILADGGIELTDYTEHILLDAKKYVQIDAETYVDVNATTYVDIEGATYLKLTGDSAELLLDQDAVFDVPTGKYIGFEINSSEVARIEPWTRVDAHATSATAIPNASSTTVVFDTENTDSLGEYNNSTGIFTATYAGDYLVCAACLSANVAWNTNEAWQIEITINGTVARIGDRWVAQGNLTTRGKACIARRVSLSANDTVEISITQNRGGATNTHGSSDHDWLTISRIL